MQFELRHESEMSAALMAQHPLWAQYHEPDDIEVIASWGISRATVESALESVGWSDSYIFPVLQSTDVSRFYFFYAAATFRAADGTHFAGFVSDFVPTSLWVFHNGERLLLSLDDPELTQEDERALRASLGGQPIYPVEICSCVQPLQKLILNPYIASTNVA